MPTPRVDKNGRLTTRHMRPEEEAAPASLNVPKPSLGTSSKPPMSDKEFLAYLDPDNKNYEHPMYQDALYSIAEHSPNVIEDAMALLELGNEAGSKSVRDLLEENLNTLVFQATQQRVVSSRIDGYEDSTDSLKEALAINWAVGSLSSEAPDQFLYSVDHGIRKTLALHNYTKQESSEREYDSDLSYWRAVGATAILISPNVDDMDDKEILKARELIQWMETKGYLGDIIRVGVDRGLRDVESIKGILESGTPTSLSSGAL